MALSSFNRIKQAGDLVVEIGVEVGLPRVQDPFTSSDPQYQRMIQLLNVSGNELLELYPWTRLISRYAVTTQDGISTYDLPPDWDAMIDQTLWRKGGLYPGYPSTAQIWQYYSNIFAGVTLTVLFREQYGKLLIWPTIGAGVQVSMEYRSRGWVSAAQDAASGFKDNVALATDWVLHDPLLIGRYLKLKFLEALGFDTQAAKDDFNIVLEARSSKDQSAPLVSAAAGMGNFRLLGLGNIPETNIGI